MNSNNSQPQTKKQRVSQKHVWNHDSPEAESEGASAAAAAVDNSGKQTKKLPLGTRVNRNSPPGKKNDSNDGVKNNPTESVAMASTRSLSPKEELMFQMFGGKFGPHQNLPGMHFSNLALKCLARGPDRFDGTPMTPRDFLLSCGVVENDITKSLFRYADRQVQIPGLSVQNLAIKLLSDLITFQKEACSGLDDLTSEKPDYSFSGNGNGATARYFPVPDKGQDHQAEEFRDLNRGEEARLLDDIGTWLGEVPEDHIRFFHGTDSYSADQIVVDGVSEDEFVYKGVDFGRAFYCTKVANQAFHYGLSRASSGETKGKRGCIISFDVHSKDYDSMEKYVVADDEWKTIAHECRNGAAQKLFGTAAVVEGSMSDGTTWHLGIDDLRMQGGDMQYAFRRDHGNILLADRAKVKVAVFDVEVEETDDEGNEED